MMIVGKEIVLLGLFSRSDDECNDLWLSINAQ